MPTLSQLLAVLANLHGTNPAVVADACAATPTVVAEATSLYTAYSRAQNAYASANMTTPPVLAGAMDVMATPVTVNYPLDGLPPEASGYLCRTLELYIPVAQELAAPLLAHVADAVGYLIAEGIPGGLEGSPPFIADLQAAEALLERLAGRDILSFQQTRENNDRRMELLRDWQGRYDNYVLGCLREFVNSGAPGAYCRSIKYQFNHNWNLTHDWLHYVAEMPLAERQSPSPPEDVQAAFRSYH